MRALIALILALSLPADAPAQGTVLSRGHVDVGPRFEDGRLTLGVYDDVTWHAADDTVLQVRDEAIVGVPDDPAYAFLRADPGTDVHVIPQTQDPDVVWLGWNTQDPEVMRRVDRGVTMTLTGVQGPGSLIVFLQSGDFAEPDVLWDAGAEPEPVWVGVNTHTHANWVFSAPGVYLAELKIEAELKDGTKVSDTRRLRFAVGSAASADEAFGAVWKQRRAAPAATTPREDGGGGSALALLGVGGGAVALAAGFGAVLVRGRGAKRRARLGGGA